MSTRHTAAWVRGVSRWSKNLDHTHTCGTHFGSTAGLTVPVLNATHYGCYHTHGDSIPETERLSSIEDDPIALRRSLRLCLTEAEIIRNDSEQNTNEFMLTDSAGNSTCEGNVVEQCHIDGTRSADAQSRTSALALLGVHDQEQSSPADKSA